LLNKISKCRTLEQRHQKSSVMLGHLRLQLPSFIWRSSFLVKPNTMAALTDLMVEIAREVAAAGLSVEGS